MQLRGYVFGVDAENCCYCEPVDLSGLRLGAMDVVVGVPDVKIAVVLAAESAVPAGFVALAIVHGKELACWRFRALQQLVDGT